MPDIVVGEHAGTQRPTKIPARDPSALCAALAAVIGAAVLVGWATGAGALTSVRPDWADMPPLTALALALSGLALLALVQAQRPVQAFAGTAIAVLALGQAVGGMEAGLDRMLFPVALAEQGSLYPGRMAVAAEFLLFALGLLATRRAWQPVAEAAASVGLLIAAIALSGYLLGAHGLARSGAPAAMAAHAALAFALLFVGLLAAQPRGSWLAVLTSRHLGGTAARRLLPAAIGLPMAAGLVLNATRTGTALPAGHAVAAGMLVIMAGFFVLVTWVASRLNRADRAGEAAQAEMRAVQDASLFGIVVLPAMRDGTGRLVDFTCSYANPAARRMMGEGAADICGRSLRGRCPAHGNDLFDAYTEVVASGRPHDIEFSHDIAGRRHWYRNMAVKLNDGIAVSFLDITDRKEAEAALARTEVRHRAVVENAVDAMVVIDDKGTILHFNRAADRIFGYSAEEAVGRNIALLMPEPHRSAHDDYVANYLATGRAKIIGIGRELEGRRRDGSLVPVELSIAEWWDGGRRFFTGIMRDISKRLEAEAALGQAQRHVQDSLNLLDALIESIPEPVFAKDLAGRFLVVNSACARALGASKHEVIGKTAADFLPAEAAAGIAAVDDQVRAFAGSITSEEVVVDPAGKRTLFLSTKSPLRAQDGQVVGIVGIARDITENRQMQEELQAAKDEAERIGIQFRTLADSIPQLAWMARPDGWIFWYNKRWYEFTGASPEQMQGSGWRQVQHPDHVDGVAERIQRSWDTGEPWEDTFPMRGRDGQYRWFLSRALPVRDAHGRIVLWFGTNTDITEHLEAEAALKRAKDEAEQANRAKSRFLAAASHDLRQPVQAMVLLNAALASKLTGHPAAKVASSMTASLDALQMLLEGLLDISRLDAGVVVPNPQTIPLGPVLERLGQEYRMHARRKGLQLRVVATSCQAHTDPTLLERILRNLMENAVRYTQSGRILLGCRRRGAWVRLVVCDTGIGIAPEQQHAIFQEFFQVDNPERDRSRGLGLGLSIVSRLAQLLGHGLEVRSEPGKGSAFILQLPSGGTFRPQGPAATETALKAPPGTSLVLVIDDEAIVRQGLQLLLQDWGCEVLVASDGSEAVGLIQALGRVPDLILADYRLKGGHTGTHAVGQVHRAVGRVLPTIIITGDTAPERIAEVQRSGFRIAHKPVAPERLRELMGEMAL